MLNEYHNALCFYKYQCIIITFQSFFEVVFIFKKINMGRYMVFLQQCLRVILLLYSYRIMMEFIFTFDFTNLLFIFLNIEGYNVIILFLIECAIHTT